VADFDAATRLMVILNAYDTNALFCCLMKTNLLYLKTVYEEAKLSQDAVLDWRVRSKQKWSYISRKSRAIIVISLNYLYSMFHFICKMILYVYNIIYFLQYKVLSILLI